MAARSERPILRPFGLLDGPRPHIVPQHPKPASAVDAPSRMELRRGSAARTEADGTLEARVRGEFREMPGFSPTLPQAVRLFQLSDDDCTRVLLRLVNEGFLCQTADGRYRRT